MDIQAELKQGKGIGYERWAKKHNLKAMAQTLILLSHQQIRRKQVQGRKLPRP